MNGLGLLIVLVGSLVKTEQINFKLKYDNF